MSIKIQLQFYFTFSEQKAPGACINSWRFPSECSKNSCQYEASWKPSSDDTIEFNVRQKISKNSDDWIAIGFSENTRMVTTYFKGHS